MEQRSTLPDAYELFILDCESRGFTADTLRFYRDRFRLILAWCKEHDIDTLDKLTGTAIKLYLVELQRKGLSAHYVHSFARVLRSFSNFLVREELLTISPFAKVKMPKLDRKVLSALTKEEVQAILRACEYERDKAILLFMLDSGVRAAELCALNVGDVAGDGAVTVRMGKGQKGRVTYIGARARKQLLRYFTLERHRKPEADEPLFTSQRGDGGRLTANALRQMTKRLKKVTGVKAFSPHALRRTMAIHSLRNGMNIYLLARMLGHADIHVLKHYLDIVQADVQTAAKRSGVVDNLW